MIEFPSGTRFNLNTSLVKSCTLTDKQITTAFGPSCPSDSQIGTGSAIVNAMPMAPKPGVDAKVKVFVSGSDSMLILVYSDQSLLPGTAPIIIHTTVSGSQLTMELPHVVYGKSRKFKFSGVTAVIALLKLGIPALGNGSNALLTAGSCSQHRFVVQAHFTYADHGKAVLASQSKC